MGLYVSVGQFAEALNNDPEGAAVIEQDLILINKALKENNLSEHSEPLTKSPKFNEEIIDSFPYDYWHRLNRLYAHIVADPTKEAFIFPEGRASADPITMDQVLRMNSHLLTHSDCEGYYVPVEFIKPIFGDRNITGGGIFGSSQRLMQELLVIAPRLGVHQANGNALPTSTLKKLNAKIENDPDENSELLVWVAVYEAARLSIAHKTLISFG